MKGKIIGIISSVVIIAVLALLAVALSRYKKEQVVLVSPAIEMGEFSSDAFIPEGFVSQTQNKIFGEIVSVDANNNSLVVAARRPVVKTLTILVSKATKVFGVAGVGQFVEFNRIATLDQLKIGDLVEVEAGEDVAKSQESTFTAVSILPFRF